MSLQKRKKCNAFGHIWVGLSEEWKVKLDLFDTTWWRQCERCGGVRFFKKEDRYILKKQKVLNKLSTLNNKE